MEVVLQTHVHLFFFHLYFLSQVRYLLQGGANVVRCAVLFVGALVGAPLLVDHL